MIRFWERAVRRADLPVRLTEGFNPRPRLVFPHALGVGVASAVEEVEIELVRQVPPSAIRERLAAAAAPTLAVDVVTTLPPVRAGRRLVRSQYRFTGWPNTPDTIMRLKHAAAEALSAKTLPMERGPADKRVTVDIRPFVEALVVESGENGVSVLASVRHEASGAARPDEIGGWFAERLGLDRREWDCRKVAADLER